LPSSPHWAPTTAVTGTYSDDTRFRVITKSSLRG
jgi:hypothetical protein